MLRRVHAIGGDARRDAGRPAPRGSRMGPENAHPGRNRHRPPTLPCGRRRRPAVGLRRGSARAQLAAARRGIAEAATLQASSSPVLVSVFLAGGIDALSVLAPVGDPLYAKLRPTLAVSPEPGRSVHRGPDGCTGTRRQHRSHSSTTPARSPCSRDRLLDPDMSHFTSRHYWEVGATETRARRPAGWVATSTSRGSPTNPSRACRWTAR